MSNCKCPHCSKKFRSIGAMEMHARDKHPVQVSAALRAAPRSARQGGFWKTCMGSFVGTAVAVIVLALASTFVPPNSGIDLASFQRVALGK